ncbi:MAG: bifunctional UDP-N-acetylglucosamine diphosphorylase/glucosamine-1-phosphate N-acetyltransferase GlmU [Limnochordales bacterium]|nr:bifunctional UDP-N-acetylglucosamine diphosphorylase/glucosamine-1-phosphate N-acetyltransferase GlmU [Limnochordales bacterium]
MSQAVAVVLAAGQGTRMRSKRPKVLHPLCGRPMLHTVVETVRRAGAGRVIVVVGHGADEVRAACAGLDVEFVEQRPQLGTGHAVAQAEPLLGQYDGPLLVTYGDTPLWRPETLADLLARHRASGAAASVISAVVDEPAGYGRVVRDKVTGRFLRIVEQKDASAEEAQIREINSGTYCFDAPRLFAALREVEPVNAQGEYYLPDVLTVLERAGHAIEVVIVPDAREVLGVNNRAELARAEKILRRRIVEEWMLAGVTVEDPDTVYIDPRARLEADAVILPFTFIRGASVIGEDCRIGPHAEIEDSEIGRGAVVERAVVRQSRVGPGCTVGPFAFLRPGTVLEAGAKAGTFVEIKQSVIGPGSKVPHLAYLGDATLGRDVNVGAGTITCNYDGERKHPTFVGDGAFIGSNTNLVAPVRVGEGAYIGAGSTISRDVPPDALAVERAEQRIIEGWAAKRRSKRMAQEAP